MQVNRVGRFRSPLSKRLWPSSLSRGFTLIELLVVLAILGLLAAIVAPNVMKFLKGAKTKTAQTQIANLGGALEVFSIDVGRLPTTDEGLQALVEDPGDVTNWFGPYLKKSSVPKDPWGFEYHYKSPGDHGSYDLWTLGADNRDGGEGEDQDVNSWD
jgi:general secretion pathway protein G